MHIDLEDVNLDEFDIKNGTVAGEPVFLVCQKHMGARYNHSNLVHRSSMWNGNGEPISLSFSKFFNYAENVQLVPDPTDRDLKRASLIEKIDGSLLIASIYNGQKIIRTRGTIDAHTLENGAEIDYLLEKHPLAFDNEYTRSHFSVLLEWSTRSNRIILDYGPEPQLWLVGCIDHNDYGMWNQEELDRMARQLKVNRPKRYQFSSVADMINSVQAFSGVEGICIYYHNDQIIKKLKSIQYLTLHSMKNDLSLEKMVDYYIEFKPTDYQEFFDGVAFHFDHEIAQMAIPYLSRIMDASEQVDATFQHMLKYVEPLKSESRKSAALAIISAYGKTTKSGLAFTLLDGKPLTDEMYKKLIYLSLGKL